MDISFIITIIIGIIASIFMAYWVTREEKYE